MAERQPGENRNAERRPGMRNHRGNVITIVIAAERKAIKAAYQEYMLARQHAGIMQLIEHALDAVRMLPGVFDEQNAAFDTRQIRRAHQMSQHGQVAAPQRAFGGKIRWSLERKFHAITLAAEQPPAMLEGEGRRILGAKIVGRQWPSERHHACPRQRGELKGSEVTVAKPAFARSRKHWPVQAA